MGCSSLAVHTSAVPPIRKAFHLSYPLSDAFKSYLCMLSRKWCIRLAGDNLTLRLTKTNKKCVQSGAAMPVYRVQIGGASYITKIVFEKDRTTYNNF